MDIVTWLIGAATSVSTNLLSDKLQASNLHRTLEVAVRDWAAELPGEIRLTPGALFRPTRPPDGSRPRYSDLLKTMCEGRLPEHQQWLDALVEQWLLVQVEIGLDVQGFFAADRSVVEVYLVDLARRLAVVCSKDETLFRTSTAQSLRRIEDHLQSSTDVPSKRADDTSTWFTTILILLDGRVGLAPREVAALMADYNLALRTAHDLRIRVQTEAELRMRSEVEGLNQQDEITAEERIFRGELLEVLDNAIGYNALLGDGLHILTTNDTFRLSAGIRSYPDRAECAIGLLEQQRRRTAPKDWFSFDVWRESPDMSGRFSLSPTDAFRFTEAVLGVPASPRALVGPAFMLLNAPQEICVRYVAPAILHAILVRGKRERLDPAVFDLWDYRVGLA